MFPPVRKALLWHQHHRAPEFLKEWREAHKNLRWYFNTRGATHIMVGTGTGAMEACLNHVLNPQDTVAVLNSGHFGARWAAMARAFGFKVWELNLKWGQSLELEVLKNFWHKLPYAPKAFCMQACETSTGALHPTRAVGDFLASESETLFCVDAMSALGVEPLPMDGWHVDVMLGCGHKALALPAGLVFLGLSKKAQKIKSTSKKFYWAAKGDSAQSAFSAPTGLIKALNASVQIVRQQGRRQTYREIAARAKMVRTSCAEHGWELLAQKPCASLSAFMVPNGRSLKVQKFLRESYGIYVAAGQGQLYGKIIRIGHMGHQTKPMQKLLIRALGKCN